MLGRQSVRVTYAHKRRRVHNASKTLLSSPLEVLPPDTDDLTRTQMARRMLKRSRRVALAEQLEDKNVEHIRDHLAKRIKRTQERDSNLEPAEASFDVPSEDDFGFQTPFPSSQSVHESAVAVAPAPEQLSPVPLAKRVTSRTSSRNLKENGARSSSQTLASPFSSRPGSAAPSPKHKGRGRSSRRVSRISLHAKSRTLSGVFKENTRRVSRKDSTVSLKDTSREPSARHIKHQRYPSSPSTSYMRSQFPQEDWIAPPKAFLRPFDDYDELPSSGGSVHSNASFYADQPQSCSTPAISRLRKLPDLHGRRTRTANFLAPFSLRKDSAEVGNPDVDMMDSTVPPRRQTVHISGNSIFSSSDEFTIGSLPAMHNGGTVVERNSVTGRNETPARVVRQVPAHRETVDDESQAGYSLAGSFVAEYDIPLSDLDYSLASTTVTKMLAPEGVPKLSEGKQPFCLPGTSPARGENLVIRASKNLAVPKLSVGKQSFGLPGTSPARGENLVIRKSRNLAVSKLSVGEQIYSLPGTSPARGANLVIRTSKNPGTLTPPPSPPSTTGPCPPSSPASDLALELRSMDIRGDPDTHSDEETNRPSTFIPLQARSRSLRDAVAESTGTTKKSVKRQPARNRAGTIRASDFAKPGAVSSSVVAGSTVPPLSNVRRTRSGTVVGPESKLVTKCAGLPDRAARGAAATRLVAVQSESESDDELLLKGFWVEDMEYLGLAVPPGRKEAEADEMNLGGLWHGLESGPPRRPGLRRR
ncbi:hypothetical protein OG21DRAFT_1485849 [Imleria badia]|nr:hypothetical protein OG21DRAFT_1485849 [Imleria badia]